MSLTKETLVIAGLEVNVYSASPTTIADRKEVVVLFLLHGRYGRAEEVDPVARSLIEQTSARSNKSRSLLVITFDQRNHGKRLVERKGNEAWSKDKTSSKHNERHAIDMYAIQSMSLTFDTSGYVQESPPPAGTARDVSLLIDFLPSFLYPDNEAHPIVEWAVAGISLGGHATWITLASDDRVTTGIPIIGCPDFSKLIVYRAKQNDVELVGRYYPKSFKDLVAKMDPASLAQDPSNPFLGKKVLVLSGASDKLVPWEASEEFVTQKLNVGKAGSKKVIVYDGVGHECTERMVQEMAEFVADSCLCSENHKL